MTDQLFDPGPALVRGREAMPLDLIWTTTPAHVSSFVAHDAGWLIGIRSSAWKTVSQTMPAWQWKIKELSFVDNEWHNYKHDEHVAAVRDIRPKYATVYDILDFYEVPRAIEEAQELEAYAENVIVIPKIDCLDRIPDRFVIGLSVPTTYGATGTIPKGVEWRNEAGVPMEAFRGRRIHLLGGSWQTQRTLLMQLGDDVVSADLNHPWKASRFGTVIMGDGTGRDLVKDLGMYPRNPSLAALTLSLGNIAAAAQDISHLREAHRRGGDGSAGSAALGMEPLVPRPASPTLCWCGVTDGTPHANGYEGHYGD